jgi:hypothetical protein
MFLGGCSVFGIRTGYEQPSYQVIDKLTPTIEIRRYGERLAAETTVDTRDTEAGANAAFRILAAYIFGANRAQETVAMTAPVEVRAASTSVAMTAPVETVQAGDAQLVMRFFLPSELTLATAPEPTDTRVRLVVLPETTVAALCFSGSSRMAQTAVHRQVLLRALEASPWQPIGVPTSLVYDPPWTIPFLRRNEVAVAVARH